MDVDRTKREEEKCGPLSEELKRCAKLELGEDEKTKRESLQHLRSWILKNKNIQNAITSDRFLLRFLRCRKYKMEVAKQSLIDYISTRQSHPDWFSNLDWEIPRTRQILSSQGSTVVRSTNDSYGNLVIVVLKKYDFQTYSIDELVHTFNVMAESFMYDEISHIKGCHYIFDASGIGLFLLQYLTPFLIHKLAKALLKSYPLRHKSFHVINLNPVYTTLLQIVLSIVSDKLAKRFVYHKNERDLKEYFPVDMLPIEYGGTVTWDGLMEMHLEEYKKWRETLLRYDKMSYDTKRIQT